MKNDCSWNLGGDYIAHYGVSVANGAKVGSGRYRLGSGKDPYQHGQLKSVGDYRRALNRFDTDRVQYQANADRAALKANKQNAKAIKVIARAYSSADFDSDVNGTIYNKKLSKIRSKQLQYESERDQNQVKANAVSDKIDQVIKDAESDGYDVNSKQVQKFADTGSLFIAQVVGGLPASIGFYAATAKYNNQEGKRYSVKKGDKQKEADAKSQADFDGDTWKKELSKQSISKQGISKQDDSSSSKDVIKNINSNELRKKDSNGYYKGIDRKVSFDGGKTYTYVNMDVTAGQMSRDKNGKVHETLASDEQIKDYQKRSNNYLSSLADAKNNEKLRDKIADVYYEKAWVNDDPETKITRDEFKKNLTINSIGIDPNHNNVTVYWDDGGSYYGHAFAYSTKLDGNAVDIDKYGISLEG